MRTRSSLAKVLRYDAVVAAGQEPGDLRMGAGIAELEFATRCAGHQRHSRVFSRADCRRKIGDGRFESLRLSTGVLPAGN